MDTLTETVSLNLQPLHLSNEWVKLQPLQEQDLEPLYQVASDPLIWEQHPANDRYKREVFQQYFDEAIASKSAFLVYDNVTGELAGCTRYYDYHEEANSIAIGYTFLARRYWGGNYNSAMKCLMLFHIGPDNIRSQKATLKLGAHKVTEMNISTNGQEALRFEYVIEKKEWQDR